MNLIKKIIFIFCINFLHGESLDEFQKGKAYCKNSKGDFLTRKEFIGFIADKTTYKSTKDENLINRYFNTLWFSLVDKFDECSGYENVDVRLKFYSDSIIKNDTNCTETLTTFAILCKISGEDYKKFDFLKNKDQLLRTVDYYYDNWNKKFFSYLGKFNSEFAKNTLTYGTAFSINSKLEILESKNCEINVRCDTESLIGIKCDDFSFQEEDGDEKTIKLRVTKITSEDVLIKIFDETKKQKSLTDLFINPKGKFTKNKATTENYLESLNSDDFKDLTKITMPFVFSGLDIFFVWIANYNNMPRLCGYDTNLLHIDVDDEEQFDMMPEYTTSKKQFKEILEERFKRKQKDENKN